MFQTEDDFARKIKTILFILFKNGQKRHNDVITNNTLDFAIFNTTTDELYKVSKEAQTVLVDVNPCSVHA
jgi:hypothetical protein